MITLAIVGVVAALTLPTVINNYQKKTTALKLKKSYNIVQQAIALSEGENGPISTWSFPDGYNSTIQTEQFFDTYFKPYLKCKKDYNVGPIYSINGDRAVGSSSWSLQDGTSVRLFLNNVLNGGYAWLFIDINGTKHSPNRLGKDVFMLWYRNIDGFRKPIFRNSGNGYDCAKTINNNYAGGDCGYLIEHNNWEIPDDYPW
ncbi:hypothetical protein IJF81_04865 [bacterium]|nr:hypothetical protein [bacterium]